MSIEVQSLQRSKLARGAALALSLLSASWAAGLAQGQDAAAAPPAGAPVATPPPPPEQLPTPPPSQATVEAQPPANVPEGQWVYTNQYGWVFMPYAQNYTYVPDTGYPYEFAYRPAVGWAWLTAPWIYGVGPGPYWGPRGYVHFAWHAHPWFAHRTYVTHAHPTMMVHAAHGGFGHHRR